MQSGSAKLVVSEDNLRGRREYLGIDEDMIKILASLEPWAAQIAPALASDFYDQQFGFGPMRDFFHAYAAEKGTTADIVRGRLEKAQANYYHEIFAEAASGGGFSVSYFSKRLHVGRVHFVMDLPLNWYLSSYDTYQKLTRKYLAMKFRFKGKFREDALRAVSSIFALDMGAIAGSFVAELWTSVADKLSISAVSLTEGLSQSGEAVDQVAMAVGDIATQMEAVAEGSVRGVEVGEQGRRAVEKTVQTMLQVKNTTVQMVAGMNELNARAEEISEITEVIGRVADQTNLLALNAAIEAARAGEHGKGFAVVADEVRKLAEQSSGATGGITQLVKGIQKLVTDRVRDMEVAALAVESGSKLVDQTASAFDEVSGAIQDTSVRAENVSAATEQVSASAEEMNATFAEILSLANDLKALSEELQEKARNFGG